MITCPNCGTQNEPGSHFCEECGANLGSLASTSPTGPAFPTNPPAAPFRPTWVAGQGWVGNEPHPHADIPPQLVPEPSTGRTWLRAVLLAIAILIVLCCVSSLYASTDRGTEQLNRLGTWSAEHK